LLEIVQLAIFAKEEILVQHPILYATWDIIVCMEQQPCSLVKEVSNAQLKVEFKRVTVLLVRVDKSVKVTRNLMTAH